jgi:hypothetical protein
MIIGLMLFGLGMTQDPPLGWLAGKWCTEPKNGEVTCETWQPMGKDQVMHGVTVTTRDGQERREPMRIDNDAGRLVFVAEPQGQAPTEFHSTARDYAPPDLEFVNTRHDYPQRIRYWREGAMLMAEISLADGSKPVRWAYKRVRD